MRGEERIDDSLGKVQSWTVEELGWERENEDWGVAKFRHNGRVPP
jgi:hypothetical protein